jgi:hypothetical protein
LHVAAPDRWIESLTRSDELIVHQRVLSLLRQDLHATLGADHEAVVSHLAAIAWEITGPRGFAQKIVDDVQEYVHDTFVNSTWPTCPRHSRHPLWYRDGSWWCEADGVAVAALGELVPPLKQHGP